MYAGHTVSRDDRLDHRAALLNDLLEPADVKLDGDRRWDVTIHDERALDAILRHGSLGAGEAWMRGWWDSQALDELVCRVLRAGIDKRLRDWRRWPLLLRAWITNPQRVSKAFHIGEAHYDRGNDLFEAMLDERMVYSCGYWADAEDLDTAQQHKLDLICRKLDLKPGQRLLDIGCGWGSLARYAARHYRVSVVGVTVSRKQLELGRERCKGLDVELRLQDYRGLDERFDRIASVGMIEHVGAKNYPALFDVVRRCLAPDGLFLLHTIGNQQSLQATDPWIERHIFPRGHLPSLEQLSSAFRKRFVVEDLHNFGSDYDRTLMAWYRNFTAAWPALEARYGETFYRMWTYYLLSSAGAFRARRIQLWQFVLSPAGRPGGYRRIRSGGD